MRFRGWVIGLGFFVLVSCAALFAQYAGYYVLDGYGGVHAGGGAEVITPATAYFGWDIARDIAFIPVGYSDSIHGDGLLVLDGYGGIHLGGKLASVSVAGTPYFGWDIARALDFRRIDPQAYGASPGATFDTASDTWVQVIAESMNMVLPDAGYVVVTISSMVCNPDADYTSNGKWVVGDVGIGVNSTTSIDSPSWRYFHLGDVRFSIGTFPYEILNSTRIFYFGSSGTQRFYFLARRDQGTGSLRFIRPSITCMYFNKRWDTLSQSSSGAPLPSDLALAPNPGHLDKSAIGLK